MLWMFLLPPSGQKKVSYCRFRCNQLNAAASDVLRVLVLSCEMKSTLDTLLQSLCFHGETQFAYKLTNMPVSSNLTFLCGLIHRRITKSTVTPLWSLKIPAPACQGWSRAPSTSFRFEPERQQAVDASARTWRSRLEKQVCVCVYEGLRNREHTATLNCCLNPPAFPQTQKPFSSCLKRWEKSSKKIVRFVQVWLHSPGPQRLGCQWGQ